MKKIYLLKLYFFFLIPIIGHAQVNPRMVNPEYAQTVFYEDFTNQLDGNIWGITNKLWKDDNLYAFIDTSATVSQTDSLLRLSMLKIPGGYNFITYDGDPHTTEFITGEIISQHDFTYGVFECQATMAHDSGAFPAFWLMNTSDCAISIRNEIDIVECKVDHSEPTLDNHIFKYPIGCGDAAGFEFKQNPFSAWDQPHTFKCIYAPDRIEYWVDNTKLHEVDDINDSRYPYQRMHILLSQQVVRFNGHRSEINTPQTSTFNWVSAKEFFLAPEITCPNVICSTGTAVLDVDPLADSITWALTPGALFSGATTGTGKTAAITAATGISAQGKITYSFKMPSDEIFTAEKTFSIGPNASDFTVYVEEQYGDPVPGSPDGPFEV